MKQQKIIALAFMLALLFINTVAAQLYINNATIVIDTGATLEVKGNMANAGFIKGAGITTLNGVSAQTIFGTGQINNLKLDNTAGATIGNGSVNMQSLFGVLTLANGLLNTNGNLTLKSNDSGTARIAPIINGDISGNVTVERWIPATGRRYRLLSPSVTSATSINANWQEGQMNTTVGSNINSITGYGTHITGSGGNANGFDITQSNAPSLYLTNNAITPTYTPIGNTSTILNAGTGYFLFIRGDRSTDMTLPNTNVPPHPVQLPSTSTTLRATGTIKTGPVTTFTNTLLGGGAFNLITNPYPSPIDWSLVRQSSANITEYYTLWDPSIGYRGGFVTVKTDGLVSPIGSLATKYIQSGQAFFVQSDGGIPAISIQESHKASGNNNSVYRTTSMLKSFSASLYYTETNGYHRLADGVTAVFDTGYSAMVDGNDATEINNWDENIAILRIDHKLSIECRPLVVRNDTLPLFINNMKQQPYEFIFKANNFGNANVNATLIDNFTNTQTPLSIIDSTVVPFSITSVSASAASDRFMIVFGPSSILASNDIYIKAYKKNKKIQVDWRTDAESEIEHYEVEKSTNGNQFYKVASQLPIINGTALMKEWLDNNPVNGDNFFRIKVVEKTGTFRYSQIAKVKITEVTGTISLYPNPIEQNSFSLQFNNIKKGIYNADVVNNAGQIVFNTRIQHEGGTAIQNIEIRNNISRGSYQLVVYGNNTKVVMKFIKK